MSFQAGIFQWEGVIYLDRKILSSESGKRFGMSRECSIATWRGCDAYLFSLDHHGIPDYFEKPVINGLSDKEHPCQALADYMTLYEKIPARKNPVLAFVGDGNNVLHSLLLVAAKLGASIRYATPKKYQPDPKIVRAARGIAAKTGADIQGFFAPAEAVTNADAIYTDVWVSMGRRQFGRKIERFSGDASE